MESNHLGQAACKQTWRAACLVVVFYTFLHPRPPTACTPRPLPPPPHTHTPPPPAPLLTLTTLHPLDPPCPSRLPPQENTILLEKLVRIKMFDSGKIFKPWLGRSTFQYKCVCGRGGGDPYITNTAPQLACHARPMGRPHLTWVDTSMHDIGSLGHTLQIDLP